VLHQVAKRATALYPSAAAAGTGPCCSLLRVLCSEEPLTPCKAQAISMAMPRAELHYVFRTSEACPGELRVLRKLECSLGLGMENYTAFHPMPVMAAIASVGTLMRYSCRTPTKLLFAWTFRSIYNHILWLPHTQPWHAFLTAGITSWLVAAPPSHTPPIPATSPHTGLLIGTPLGPYTKLYVLDPQQRPVPIGVPGELHISGAAAPCGALRPGLQGACFSANPFCEGPGSGSSSMLATGCVVRWMPAGEGGGLWPLELLGRLVSDACSAGCTVCNTGSISDRVAWILATSHKTFERSMVKGISRGQECTNM
jgi:hypothetical protein